MIDIHTHVLYGLDDGCKTIEESISMIKSSVESGIKDIVCTPHYIINKYSKDANEVKERFEEVKQEVKRQGIDCNLILGQEIYYTSRIKVFDMLKNGELLTINDSKYVLVEFDFNNKPIDLGETIYDFKANKLVPIIAHVERYDWIEYSDVIKMIEEGALIQINSNSVIGLSGHSKKSFVKKLLKNGLVDFISSDMHSFRPTTLAKALELAYKKYKFTNKDIKFDSRN